MKSIFKILILATVPILAATAVVDQGLAADKGSQLIFQTNMAHTNYISIANAHDSQAVTVLVQYYNDAMEMPVWYLRVLPADGNVLINPFDHMIPGDPKETNVGDAIMANAALEEDPIGINSGRYVIAVTAVGANVKGRAVASNNRDMGLTDDELDADPVAPATVARTVNVLFPTFLAEDMHGMDNIDNGGSIVNAIPGASVDEDAAILNHNLMLTKFEATDTQTEDNTSKNVGDLSFENAEPIAFNHLTGNFTEALTSTASGGADQTASWGGTPVIRPAVDNTDNAMGADDTEGANIIDYQTLDGGDALDALRDEGTGTTPLPPERAARIGGRLAEKDAGGAEANIDNEVSGYEGVGGNQNDDEEQIIVNTLTDAPRRQRGLAGGALVLPALFGGGDMAHQIMLLLSVTDEFGGAGKYKLMPAMTGYEVTLMDSMGDALANPAAADDAVFGGGGSADAPSGIHIIVEGISVMVDAKLGECSGTMMTGPWNLASFAELVPEASMGSKDFDGLDARMDPMMNASPAWIKFKRMPLTCKDDFGDGDAANLAGFEQADGVPVTDNRTFTAGTLVVEEMNKDRAFVTTGQALLKFITPSSTFAASWSLKSPPSMPDPTSTN